MRNELRNESVFGSGHTSVSLTVLLARETETATDDVDVAFVRCADVNGSTFDAAAGVGGLGLDKYPGGRGADGSGGGAGRPALELESARCCCAERVPGIASTAGPGAVVERACGAVPLRSGTLEDAWPAVGPVGVLGVFGPRLWPRF